jgi:hypothetical protein
MLIVLSYFFLFLLGFIFGYLNASFNDPDYFDGYEHGYKDGLEKDKTKC